MFYLQDYVNWIVRDLNQPEMPELNNHDRLTTPRWVDLQIQIQNAFCNLAPFDQGCHGTTWVWQSRVRLPATLQGQLSNILVNNLIQERKRLICRHFIQRWNHLKTEKLKFNPNHQFLVPKVCLKTSG